jgi:hypothetical protein
MRSLAVVIAALGLVATPPARAREAEAETEAEPVRELEQQRAEESLPPRLKLLVLDVKSVELEPGQAETLTALLAARAARFPSLRVMSSADLRELADLEADKQEAGCDDDNASCLAEIAGALGADLVLTTRAGRLDGIFIVSLQLFDARRATAEGRASVQAWSLGELPEKMGPALDEILETATGARPVEPRRAAAAVERPPLAVDQGTRLGLQVGGGIAAAAGVLAVASGALPALAYDRAKTELRDRTTAFTGATAEIDEARDLREEALAQKELYNGVGRWVLTAGAALVAAGGIAVAAGFFLPAADEEGGAP